MNYFYDSNKYSKEIVESCQKFYSDLSEKFKIKMKENNLVIERLLSCINSSQSSAIKIVYDYYFSKFSVEEIAAKYNLTTFMARARLLLGLHLLLKKQASEKWFLINEHYFPKELLVI